MRGGRYYHGGMVSRTYGQDAMIDIKRNIVATIMGLWSYIYVMWPSVEVRFWRLASSRGIATNCCAHPTRLVTRDAICAVRPATRTISGGGICRVRPSRKTRKNGLAGQK